MNVSALVNVQALAFDVFGTVVDWRKSVEAHLRSIAKPSHPFDVSSFASDWRQGYYNHTRKFALSGSPSISRNIDQVHWEVLHELLRKYGLEDVWTRDELVELNLIWHRLEGWPDSSKGLEMLKRRYIIATLSNGNARLLVDMAKYSQLPWDVIFSGDIIKSYKPNEAMYLGACKLLQLEPGEVAMVAAHLNDLKAANSLGLRTIYVRRDGEEKDSLDNHKYVDLVANSFVEVAQKLGIKE